MQERLHKVLAHCGVASRRDCEEIIQQGRVTVNGSVVTKQGVRVDPREDEIRVDGERVTVEATIHYLVHKPRGYICTNQDERGRPRVVDLIPDHRRIYAAGRLDEQSEGLLLVTNDGLLANVVCHPRYQVDKTYRLAVDGHVAPADLDRIERGVWLAEGKSAPAWVRRVDRQGRRTIVTVSIWEGRNRELRRIFAKVGLRVSGLVRTAIGPLKIAGLPVGAYRRLEEDELGFLRERLEKGWKPARVEPPPPGRWAARLGGRRPGGRQPGRRRTSRSASDSLPRRHAVGPARNARRPKPGRRKREQSGLGHLVVVRRRRRRRRTPSPKAPRSRLMVPGSGTGVNWPVRPPLPLPPALCVPRGSPGLKPKSTPEASPVPVEPKVIVVCQLT